MSIIGTLILPAIILFIIAVVLLSTFFGKKFNGAKSTKLLIVFYLGILTISVIVYYCIPKSSFVTAESHTPNITYEEIHQAIEQGTIENFKAIKEKERWSIPYKEDKLNVEYFDNIYAIFDRKESDDDTIDVIYYVANTNYNGYDFHDELQVPTVSVENNQLLASPIVDQMVTLYSFHNDFTVSQFKGGGMTEDFGNWHNDNRPLNYDFLMIRVPKSLELIGSEFINFLGE